MRGVNSLKPPNVSISVPLKSIKNLFCASAVSPIYGLAQMKLFEMNKITPQDATRTISFK